MKAGKISEAVLKRSVLKPVNQYQKEKAFFRAGVGTDAGLFALQEEVGTIGTASTVLAGNEKGTAELAIYRACNSLASALSDVQAVTVQVMLPESMEEDGLKQTMEELLSACRANDVLLLNGHTQVSSKVTERVISVTAIGTAKEGRSGQQEEADAVLEKEELVMIGTAGMAGTLLLARTYREELHERYTYAFIDKAQECCGKISCLSVIRKLKELGVTQIHDVSEGGIFGAVWEFAERLQTGVEIDLKKIPILQQTVELCEFFDINPYQLKGDGALLFSAKDSAYMIEELRKCGISAAVIGRWTKGNDRLLLNEDEVRHLEPNRTEEYEKAERERK